MPAKAEKVIFSAVNKERSNAMRDNQLMEMIERYLNGEMTVEEHVQFDALRKSDATIDENCRA
jgi:serine protease Do